ncbi:MAG: DMT family transporter [Chloroflexi bacterium]|nr:DMT family transporter [Chloroflexota bacterium]
MNKPASQRTKAILQALLVTMLWSSSWILIKFTISDIPPLTFAGLRYGFASLFLLPGLLKNKTTIRNLTKQNWQQLILLGIVFYTFTQGGQFITLKYLPTVTFSLLLNFSSVFIAIFGIFLLHEKPSLFQWAGIAVFIIGVLLYFTPNPDLQGEWIGYFFAGFTVLANALAALLGRMVNRHGKLPASVTTGISMSIGAIFLLLAGLTSESFPTLSITNWIVILSLAAVNTAFAFTLWNKSLQVLSAVESGVLNNSMLVQIALLSWIFLRDALSIRDWISLLIATAGMVMVNLRKNPKPQ